MQVIYVDVLFLMNFSSDFLILSLTSRLLRRDCAKIRLFLAAALGGIYAILATLFLSGVIASVATAIALGLMVLLSFGYGNAPRYLRTVLSVWLLATLFGGITTLVWSKLREYLGENPVRADTGAKLVFFLLLSVLGYLLVRLAARLSGVGHDGSVRVRISLGDSRRNCELLLDNACFLREPLTGKAVIILSRQSALGLLPDAVVSAKEEETPTLHGEQRRRYYPIICKTVGGRRLLHGYRPDRVELLSSGKRRELSVLVAVGDAAVTDFRGCDGIIPSGIVKT